MNFRLPFLILVLVSVPSLTQATDIICEEVEDRPFFQVSSVTCVGGPCENLAVYAVYDQFGYEPEQMIAPQQILEPNAACKLVHEFSVEMQLESDTLLNFYITQYLNDLPLWDISIYVNGIEQAFPYEIPYDSTSTYEIRQDGVIIKIDPHIQNGQLTGTTYSCINGCTELSTTSDSYKDTLRYTVNPMASACSVAVVRTSYGNCNQYSYHLVANAVLSTGERLGVSQGNDELLIRKYPESSVRQEITDITVGPYQLRVQTTDETRKTATREWTKWVIGFVLLGTAVILVTRRKKHS